MQAEARKREEHKQSRSGERNMQSEDDFKNKLFLLIYSLIAASGTCDATITYHTLFMQHDFVCMFNLCSTVYHPLQLACCI